jgi:hypothetical protein
MMPPLLVCAVIVFVSSVVGASGGLPVALAVTSHDPRAEPAMAAEPVPVAMVPGAQPLPKQSPIDIMVAADDPEAQRSGAAAKAATVRNVLFMMVNPVKTSSY